MILLTAMLSLVGIGVSAAQPDLRLHFAGAAALGDEKNAKELTQIRTAPESVVVGRLVRVQFGAYLGEMLGLKAEAKKQLGYAVDRLNGGEICIEVAGAKVGAWRAALQLETELAKKVQSNLRSAFAGSGATLKHNVDSTESWTFKWKDSPEYHVSHQRGWLVIDGVSKAQPSEWRQEILLNGRPVPAGKSVVAIAVSSRFIERAIAAVKFPVQFEFNATIRLTNGRLRTEAELNFKEQQALKLDPFVVPTNTVRGPLNSFLVARGFAGLIGGVEGLREWRIPQIPNQLVAWSQLELPMYSMAIVPFPKVQRYIDRQKARVFESLNPSLAECKLGKIEYMDNFKSFVWRGLPLWAPFVGAAPETNGNWAVIGSVPGYIPRGPNTNPPPAELMKQISGRPELIYYHWELTPPRLEQVHMMVELARMMSVKAFPAQGNPFPNWLRKINPLLGNTITEVNRVSDTRWKLIRNSQIGLTATELALLTHWLTPKMEIPKMPVVPPSPGAAPAVPGKPAVAPLKPGK